MKRTGFKSNPKPMKKRSGKVRQPKSATGPMYDADYKAGVKALDCCCCGVSGPSDIHHCKDRPPIDVHVYRYFPGYGETSADFDGIPLCRVCHDMYHRHKGDFRALYGVDYQYIPTTRAEISLPARYRLSVACP